MADNHEDRPLSGPEVAKSLWMALDSLANSVAAAEKTQFSADDIAAIKLLLEQDRRTRWLWTTARTWALWVTAVVAGFTVGLDALKAALKRLIT